MLIDVLFQMVLGGDR